MSDTDTLTGSEQQPRRSSPDERDPKPSGRTKNASGSRSSLACIQCRQKHARCDAVMPACTRCQLEKKPCFYAKSRRGIRDPKKRSMMLESLPAMSSAPALVVPVSKSPAMSHTEPYQDLTFDQWTGTPKSQPANLAVGGEDLLFHSYYTHFHAAHPWLPPKRFLLRMIDAEPDLRSFLLLVIRYVGSIYLDYASSENLQELAFAAACGSLPMTAASVQGLLILSAAALGLDETEYYNGCLDRAISIALEIGMHHKSFADTPSDPIIAESYRRTWWSLYLHEVVRGLRHLRSGTALFSVSTDVDLPCEEWEYESAMIPPPVSVAQYEIQSTVGKKDFSSMAYLVDACRICADPLSLHEENLDGKITELIDRADSRLCAWLIRVPKWKLELADTSEAPDLVIAHAIAVAHAGRLAFHQGSSRHDNLRELFPLGPATGPHRHARKLKSFGWNCQPMDIQTSNNICELIRQSLPIKKVSPIVTRGVLRAAFAYLDACVFLGLDSPKIRDRLSLVIQFLTVQGEIWPASRKLADEVKGVMAEYLINPHQGTPPTPPASEVPETVAIATPNMLFLPGSDFPDQMFASLGPMPSWMPPSHQQINA